MVTHSQPMTAVVAEDEPEIRELVTEYLVRRGFQVTPAADGLETLLQIKRVRPALLMLDLMMPRLGGIDTLVHIRRDFPDVVVIVMTGTPDDALRGRALMLGAAARLPKPLDLDALGMIIATVTTVKVGTAQRVGDLATGATSARDSAKVRILVVDDDEEVRNVLGEFVESKHHRALLAPDALAALRIIIDQQPEIVLLDIQMPRLGGIEALTAIHAIAPATKVIMISDVDTAEVAQRALTYGAFDYVKKPVDLAYLQHSLEIAVRMKK